VLYRQHTNSSINRSSTTSSINRAAEAEADLASDSDLSDPDDAQDLLRGIMVDEEEVRLLASDNCFVFFSKLLLLLCKRSTLEAKNC
jgi:hypothetical protein